MSEVSSDNMHHVDKKIIDDIKDSAHLMPGMPTESALPQIVIPCVVLSMASAVASVITHGWDGEVSGDAIARGTSASVLRNTHSREGLSCT